MNLKCQGGFFHSRCILLWVSLVNLLDRRCTCVCLYMCGRPGTCSCVSVSACVCLMRCPKRSPHWDIMVRQTYSTTQIKINKQSEVFTLNTASFLSSVFSMNIQHGQDLSSLDRSCPWERLDSVSKNEKKIEGEGEKRSVERKKEVLCKLSNDAVGQIK